MERQITFQASNKILTNINVWTYDSKRIVYDVRSDKNGSEFDGNRIESVNIETGAVDILYESKNGANCGVVTCSPVDERIVFIHGPENPDSEWTYGMTRRRGVIRHANGETENMDAAQFAPPFVSGALRGGSHVHVFSGDGRWVSFTYQDQILHQSNLCDQRNIGVSVPLAPVCVNREHPRNLDGTYFSVLISRTVNNPKPGSDEIQKAYEDGWVGTNGYIRADGTRQEKAVAFLGDTIDSNGNVLTEVFIADLPQKAEKLAIQGDGPICGTETRRPLPPKGISQRRLTRTEQRKFPGVFGTRHWVRSSPNGEKIAFLMRDENGIVQIACVSPIGGKIEFLTQNSLSVESGFTWHPDGNAIAHLMDGSVCVTVLPEKKTLRLTKRCTDENSPLTLCVAFSPDGKQIAYLRNVLHENGNRFNQIYTCPSSQAFSPFS